MGEYSLVKIVKSTKPEKKLMAVFKNKKTGREKTVHFGDATMSDYTKHKDKDRRENYRSRHKKDLNTGDPTRAGFLSYYILWGSDTSQRESIKAYKERFFPSSVKSPSRSVKSPSRSVKSPSRSVKSPSRSVKSPSRSVKSPSRSVKSPSRSVKSPLSSVKSPKGLKRWFAEEWVDEKGLPCGSSKNKETKKCRPKKRISEGTPVTWGEMSPSQKSKAVKEKKQVGMGRKASPIKKKSVSSPKKSGTKLCARGKKTAQEVFDVYPSAYANGYAVQVCKGKKKDYNGEKKCSPPYC